MQTNGRGTSPHTAVETPQGQKYSFGHRGSVSNVCWKGFICVYACMCVFYFYLGHSRTDSSGSDDRQKWCRFWREGQTGEYSQVCLHKTSYTQILFLANTCLCVSFSLLRSQAGIRTNAWWLFMTATGTSTGPSTSCWKRFQPRWMAYVPACGDFNCFTTCVYVCVSVISWDTDCYSKNCLRSI